MLFRSNTEPSPYVISENYALNGTFKGYFAFDGSHSTYWRSNSPENHYITIDIFESVSCNAILIGQAASSGLFVKRILLQGSQDGIHNLWLTYFIKSDFSYLPKSLCFFFSFFISKCIFNKFQAILM